MDKAIYTEQHSCIDPVLEFFFKIRYRNSGFPFFDFKKPSFLKSWQIHRNKN